jgi:polyamine oxidase
MDVKTPLVNKFQQFEKQYPGSNVLLVTVTDDESRRIEQQSNNRTKAEAVEVLRKMFPGKDVPDATDILVPRWWSNRFFKGSFSNWPIGVNRYEYDLLRVGFQRNTSNPNSNGAHIINLNI